jgi:dUTP pyrophosphatase
MPIKTTKPKVSFKRLNKVARVPEYMTKGAAGMDIRSTIDTFIYPNKTIVVPTGLAASVPEGWELQVRPRSGLAARHSVTVLNSPGTIDSDYTGEIMVILHNCGTERFVVAVGDRIAQLVLNEAPQCAIEEVDDLAATDRGEGGFGSTGVK